MAVSIIRHPLKTNNELEDTRISEKGVIQLLEKCSVFGPYQRRVYTYILICKIFSVITALCVIFSTANVPFLCYPPNFNASLIPANLTENEYLEMLQPDDDQCSVYNNSFIGTYYATPPSNSSKLQCSYGRTFLTESFSTIVSEFDLVCDRKWLKSTLQSVYFAGYLCGCILFGILSDRFGRTFMLLWALIFLTVFGLSKIFVPSLAILIILYGVQAVCLMGTSITFYALSLEFASIKLRVAMNFVYMTIFASVSMILPGLAHAIPDWHYFELAVCLQPIISILAWKFIPESPRWLVGRKRFAEAKTILRKMMEQNKIHSQECNVIFTNDVNSFEQIDSEENVDDKRESPGEKNYTFIDLFKTFYLASITLNICFSWFVMSMLYYGITLNSVDMVGNRSINFLLMLAVELPACLCCYYLFLHFGHRKPISFFMMFSGLNCIVSNFVTEGSFWLPLILIVLGKFGISAAFNSVYLLTAEIFPTVARTNGLGLASMTARLGSICAPFILHLSSNAKWLPLSIFGILSVVSGSLLLLLPETKDKGLPQTFEDLENWKN